MLSLYVRPITFDNKKNEILQRDYNIEWKKQVSTVSIKKGLSAIDFLNQKINNKIFGYEIAIKENTPSVFAYFDYIEEDNRKKQIFLVNNTNINENNQSYTNLYYKSHIPEKESINIVINNKDVIKKHKDYLKITGQVLAFCIDINTYYLENININEYVEFVQNNDYDADDADDNYADSDIDSNADSNADGNTNITPQENSDSENTDASDNESNTVSSIVSKKFDKYISTIMEIYNKPETPILDFKSLFSHLNSQLNDYKQIVSDPVKINEDIDIYYVHTHGAFNFESGFQQIPENIVLVFLTPVNRYGFTCKKSHYKQIIKTLRDISIKQYF